MNIIWGVFISLIFFSVILIVPILIGVYVYRDATRRGMNALVWTLIALFAPSLIGFIIYLLVRSSYSDLECPRCQTTIKDEYVLCPKCGAKLRPFCPNCSAPVEPDWKVCPRCAAPLEEIGQDVVVPTRKKDKSLGVILLVVILIPVILILAMIGLFTFQMAGTDTGTSGRTSIAAVVAEEYVAEVQNPEISAWYANCTDDRVHILMHGEEERGRVRYLIYMPELRDPVSIGFDNNAGFMRNKLQIDYTCIGETDSAYLIHVTCTGEDAKKNLVIFRDGEEMDCVMEGTAYGIEITDNAMLVAEEYYTSGGRNGALYVGVEEVPAAQAGE